MNALLRALLTLAVATTGVAARIQEPPRIEVAAKRFLRGDATLVDGFCRVPFGFLSELRGIGEPRGGAYRLRVAVRDAGGTVLHESDWSQVVAPQFMNMSGASTIEHFAFTVPSGDYSVSVTVTDSASARSATETVNVQGLAAGVLASDLYLTNAMRRASDETAPAPGELRKGALLLAASTTPVLTPRQPELYYYVELYPHAAVTVTLTARVLTAAGSLITAAAPESLTVGADGGVAARTLDLTGLPPGSYRLAVTTERAGEQEVREARFEMAGFETEAAIAAATRNADVRDPFAELTEARLDSLYAPTTYLQESDERGVYDGLTLDGKRTYLRRFWERRDPSASTPDNEFRDAYYRLFEEANRRFRESGSGGVPGWRTDRGRVFLKRGEPEEVLRRPTFGQNPPYEVWKYSRPRQLKYLFLDQVGLGQYQLVYTDDRFETSRGDWTELLTAEAIDDVLRF